VFDALRWFDRFIDGWRQDREELGLFPRLEPRPPDRGHSVLSELMHWHGHERKRFDEMSAQIEGAAYGDALSPDLFTCAARADIDLRRKHSQVEDQRLPPLAQAVLTPEDDALILAEYGRLERRHVRPREPKGVERAQKPLAHAARWKFRQPRSDSKTSPASTLDRAGTPRGAA